MISLMEDLGFQDDPKSEYMHLVVMQKIRVKPSMDKTKTSYKAKLNQELLKLSEDYSKWINSQLQKINDH